MPQSTPREPDFASRIELVPVAGSQLLAFPAGRHRQRLERPAQVTICLPVRNGGANLERSLEGIAAQTFRDRDVVIVDNLSTDDTLARCAAFADRHADVTVYQNAQDLGRVGNWNRCLDLAAGRYVKFAMVNDILAPTCVERLVAALDEHPTAAIAASAVSIVNPDGSTDGGAIFPTLTLVAGRAAIEHGLRVHNIAGGPSGQLLRRAALTARGIRFDDSFSWAADWELTMQLFLAGDLVYVPERLNVLDLRSVARFHNRALSAEQFRDECRVSVRFACEAGIELAPELADATVTRLERLLAARAAADPTGAAALEPDLARVRRAVRNRISWDAAGRRVFSAKRLRIAAPPSRLEEARALAAAVTATGCPTDVVGCPGKALVVRADGGTPVELPAPLPWPVDFDRFTPRRGRPPAAAYTFLAVLDRFQGWEPLVEAFVSEFAAGERVSLVLAATPQAEVAAEAMFAAVAQFVSGTLGMDTDAIPDLNLLAVGADPALYQAADCLIFGAPRRRAEASACGLPAVEPDGRLRARLRWSLDHATDAAAEALAARPLSLQRHGQEQVARALAEALRAA